MIKKIVAQLIDEMAVLACSGIGIIIFNLILKVCGYQVVDYIPVLFIIFVIFNVLYFPILEASKLHGTIGKKFLNLYQGEGVEEIKSVNKEEVVEEIVNEEEEVVVVVGEEVVEEEVEVIKDVE